MTGRTLVFRFLCPSWAALRVLVPLVSVCTVVSVATEKWLWVKTNGIPFWLVGEFTTHFRAYLSRWRIESDVHWGLTATWLLTHGQMLQTHGQRSILPLASIDPGSK